MFQRGEMAETEKKQTTEPVRFDRNDALFYAGLLLLGVGLAFSVSWPVALVVLGAVLALVGLANSYVLVFLNRV